MENVTRMLIEAKQHVDQANLAVKPQRTILSKAKAVKKKEMQEEFQRRLDGGEDNPVVSETTPDGTVITLVVKEAVPSCAPGELSVYFDDESVQKYMEEKRKISYRLDITAPEGQAPSKPAKRSRM